MLNLIKMNLYKFPRSRCVYVCSIITVLILLISALANRGTQETYVYYDEEEMDLYETMLDEDSDSEYIIEEADPSEDYTYIITTKINIWEDFLSFITSALFLIIFGISAILLATAEFANGFIKTIAPQVKKWQIPLAKFISLGIYFICFTLFSFIVRALLLTLLCKVSFSVPEDFVSDLLIALLYIFAYTVTFTSITYIVKSKAAGIVLGLVELLGVPSLVYALLTLAAEAIFDITIEPFKYSICAGFMDASKTMYIVLCFVYLIVTSALASFITEKTDLNK